MNVKVLVASGFAVAGIGVAAWSFTSGARHEKPGERLHQVTTGAPRNDAPPPAAPVKLKSGDPADALASAAAAMPAKTEPDPAAEPANFPPIASDEDVVANMGGLEERLANTTSAVAEVTALGAVAQGKLGAAVKTALEPYFLGNRNKVLEAIAALGGTPPDPNAPPPNGPDGQPMPGPRGGPGGPLVNLLKHASLDFSRAKILPAMVNGVDLQREAMQANMRESGAVSTSGKAIPGTTPAPGAPGGDGNEQRTITLGAAPPRSEGGAPGGGPGGPRPGGDRMVMKMMQRGMYPDVEDPIKKKLTVVEVRAPILLDGETPGKGAADVEIGINMAWNPGVQQWQPAGFTLYPKDQAGAMKVAAAMQAARQAG